MGPGAARTLRRGRHSPRRRLALVAAAVLLAAPPAAAAPPAHGLLVPGESLGGVRIGMTTARVKALWGTRFGRCRECARETWYFNYRRFRPQGAGVVFQRGRVIHVFTVWKPDGWRTTGGLVLGASQLDVTRRYPVALERTCVGYLAFVVPGRRAQTVFYVFGSELWGFGLTRPESSPCL
jgi:hypothetical protein